MADELVKPDELLSQIDYRASGAGWMDTPVDIRKGMYCYASNPKSVETLGLPNARAWNPLEEDWKLPENWQQILHEGFRERLDKFRSFKVFMDICVRCGACSDKCHFFIGTGDPKNMPVLRAELLRSFYRNDLAGWAARGLCPWMSSRSGGTPCSNAPNAGAARFSALTASIPPRLPSWAGSCSTCWA